jgi:hypothetical protein
VRLPAKVRKSVLGAVNGHWQLPAPVTGQCRDIGMPHTSCRLSTDKVGETAKMGEPAEGNEEAVIVSALPELHISCDSQVDVLLLCSITVACEKANRGEPVNDMLPPWLGHGMQTGNSWE